MKSLARTILASAVLFLAPLAAAAAPEIPQQFYGTVKFDNGAVAAPDGIIVEAKTAAGVVVGSGAAKNGSYGYNPALFFVKDLNDGSGGDLAAGQTLYFFVNGIATGSIVAFASGALAAENLVLPGTIGAITKTADDVITDQVVVVTPANSSSIAMGDKLTIGISASAASQAIVQKVAKVASSDVPAISGKTLLNAYDIKITGDNLTISVTLNYDDTGIDENTVAPQIYENNVWTEINPYSINKSSNTITFTIIAGHSVYAVLGAPPTVTPSPAPAPTSGGGGGGGGSSSAAIITVPAASDEAEKIAPKDEAGQVAGASVGAYPDGTLLKAPNQSAVWYIAGGEKHVIRSGLVFESRFNWGDIITLPSAKQLDLYETGSDMAFAPGTLVKEAGKPAVYRVAAGGGLAPIVSGKVFLGRGHSFKNVIEVTAGFFDKYPRLAAIASSDNLYDGDLVKLASKATVYYVANGAARGIPSADVFLTRGFKFKDVRTISSALFQALAAGANLNYPDGTLVKGAGAAVYIVANGAKRPITSGADFEALLYNWDNIHVIPETLLAALPLSDPIRLVASEANLAAK